MAYETPDCRIALAANGQLEAFPTVLVRRTLDVKSMEHRIQVRVEDDEWDLAERAAKGLGLPTVSSLVRYLMQREYERQGLTSTEPKKKTKASQKSR